jgi:CHAD domain-containing protein
VRDGPSEETVHRLRTGTRRSGALLESLLAGRRTTAAGEQLQRDAAKLMREWRKLRRAAGKVRDLDVHRGLLAKLRKQLPPPASDLTPEAKQQSVASLSQLDHLDAWLRQEREQQAGYLKTEAARRSPRCAALVPVVLAALEKARSSRAQNLSRQSPATLALEDFFHTAYAMPSLDRQNLHDFRKRTKEARYVAEAGGEMPHAVAVAKALKRIQDAIGDWHDLDALQGEAAHALGDRDVESNNGASLRAVLQQRAEQQLQQALAVTERMRHRLLGERLAIKAEVRKPELRRRTR